MQESYVCEYTLKYKIQYMSSMDNNVHIRAEKLWLFYYKPWYLPIKWSTVLFSLSQMAVYYTKKKK